MTVNEAIGQFIIACRADRLAASTVTWYSAMLKAFGEKFGGAALDGLTTAELRLWWIERLDMAASPTTAIDEFTALRRFFNWCEAEYGLPSPMARIRSPKRPVPVPRAIDKDHFLRLLATCGETPAGIRDRAMLVFALDTGCRAAGLCTLRFVDLDVFNRRALLIEKGDKRRVVPFVDYTATLLTRWLQTRPLSAETVFCTLRGKPITYWGLREILRRRALAAGIQGRVHWHSLRHFVAREYLNNGGNLAALATLLGHSDATTTVLYYSIFEQGEVANQHAARTALHSVFGKSDEKEI